MPINATSPTVAPPIESKIYDEWFLHDLAISTHNPGTPEQTSRAGIVLRKCRRTPEGYEFADLPPVTFDIEDLFALAAISQPVAVAMGAILAAVTTIGTDKNLL
jgi:hypothetical protein